MKISTAIDNVDYQQLTLPEFQRGYVWNRGQVRGLMHSLYRQHPVGTLLTWTTEIDTAYLRGEAGAAPGPVNLLLDGQQRITSLYGVMRGHAPPFFQGDERSFTGLYFHAVDEVFEFYGPVKMTGDPYWVSVTEIFTRSVQEVVDDITSTVKGSDPDVGSLFSTLLKVRGIEDRDIYLEQITGRMYSIDEVVEIFNRINSGGTKLSAGDLALARICADWPEARTTFRRIQGTWAEHGYHFSLDWLLRCVTAVATGQARFTALRDISIPEFADALEATEKHVNFLLNLIGSRLGLDRDRVLSGRGAFSALCRYVHDNGGTISDHGEQQKILYWYLENLMWGRYSGSVETRLQRDLEVFSNSGIDGAIEELQKWRGSLEVRSSDFDWSTTGARFYPVLYMLTRTQGSKDLCSGIELTHDLLGASNDLHLHHIFPKALLYKAGYERSDVNALANMCFLTADCNIKISDSDPGDYMPVSASEQPGALESQWITTNRDLWQIDRFHDFLKDRRERLTKATNALLQSLYEGHVAFESDATLEAAAPTAVIAEDDVDDENASILKLANENSLAAPEIDGEVSDPATGEVIATADLLWRGGVQEGLTEPVALIRDLDADATTSLIDAGFHVFHTNAKFVWYLESGLGMDLDGDQIIGEPVPSD